MTDNVPLGGTLVEMLKHGLCSRSKNSHQREHANILGLNLQVCGLNLTAFNQLADIPLMIKLEIYTLYQW